MTDKARVDDAQPSTLIWRGIGLPPEQARWGTIKSAGDRIYTPIEVWLKTTTERKKRDRYALLNFFIPIFAHAIGVISLGPWLLNVLQLALLFKSQLVVDGSTLNRDLKKALGVKR